MEVSDQVILVTGGGSGLGLAMAKAFAEQGARVVITGRNEKKLESATKVIGVGSNYFVHDVADTELTPNLVLEIEREIGPISCLVNNAGTHLKAAPKDVSDIDLHRIININIAGVFALTRECAKPMAQRKSGSILMISSMAALLGLPNVSGYSITKAALLGATRSFAVDFGADGIRVNAICPGFIDTPMFRAATDKDPERQNRILARTPLGGFGEPDDIAEMAVFLASNRAKFITGAVIPVDGGFSIGF